MNKTFWIGFAVVFVLGQLLNFLVHGLALDGLYAAHAHVFRSEEDMMGLMPVMWGTGLVMSFLFCYIYTRGYESKGIMEGVRYGLLMGLFFSIPQAFDAYAVYPISLTLACMWFLTAIAWFVLLGAVFAAIYKPTAKAGL